MAIIRSCCCWRSVRRGSFACAVYSVLYYSVIAMSMATVLQEESQYLAGNRSLPKSTSVLEPEVSPMTVRFNIALLICSSCGVICCLLLLYGLFKDEKLFLVPWICIVIVCSFVDVSHLVYLFYVSFAFNPLTAMILTLDFFLLCLNVYSIICVISQYQEYAAGRGTASHDCEHRVPAVRYTVQPTTTATSCLSSKRSAPTNNETKVTATTTPTQSPTIIPDQVATEKSPTVERTNRKHVQFPDTAEKTVEAVVAQLKSKQDASDTEDATVLENHRRNSDDKTNNISVTRNGHL